MEKWNEFPGCVLGGGYVWSASDILEKLRKTSDSKAERIDGICVYERFWMTKMFHAFQIDQILFYVVKCQSQKFKDLQVKGSGIKIIAAPTTILRIQRNILLSHFKLWP